jgi:hypothetical protein
MASYRGRVFLLSVDALMSLSTNGSSTSVHPSRATRARQSSSCRATPSPSCSASRLMRQ